MLRVRLFGGLAGSWGKTPLPAITGTASRSLFAYLLTYRDRPHTRDLLAGTFWPDLPDNLARRRLTQALWQIRKALEPHSVLLTKGDTVQINPNLPIWLDIEEFARHKAQCLGEDTAEVSEALGHCELCLDHYRGDFLAGYYDDWLFPERERLRDQLLEMLERLVEGYKGRGNYQMALTYARRLASEDSLREEAHREVMRLCHVLGRSAEALQQYDICRQVLAEELGAEPSPETEGLAAEIAERAHLQESPWAPVAARPSLAPLLDHPDRLPLVGRQSVLAEMLKQVEAAVRGAGGLILVYGEAGVGKTRLLRELARNAQWRGIRTTWGRCYELAGSQPYQPLLEVLRTDLPLLYETSIEPLWRAELARLLPELATGESPTPLAPEQERHRLLEAITRGLLALARTTPGLILLEDAHWIDPDSLAAIRYLLPRLESVPLLIVVTARGEELAGHLAADLSALERTRLPRRLELGRFNLAESGELVQHALGLEQPPPRFTARLFAETEGNPFFLTETLRALVDEGLLYRDELGEWSTPWDESTEDYADMLLPDSVTNSIKGRLDRLPAPLRRSLDMAAVIGRGVPFALWQQAGDWDAEELLSIGDELCRRGLLLHAEAEMATSADYVFAHDQIRRVTYEQLAGPRRRFCHTRVAEGLTRAAEERGIPTEPGTLAYHWTAAQVWDRATAYHQQAGDRARAVYANADALAHYDQALEALAWLPGPVDRVWEFELRRAREKVYDLQGARQEQTQELAALAQLAEGLDDDRRRAEVALRRARQAERTSDFPSAIAAAGLAVELARTVGDVTIEAESHLEWGWALLLQGEHAAASAQFERALALAQRAHLHRLEADALHSLGTVCLTTAEYSQARAYLHQVLNICREFDIRPREAGALANLGWIATAQGDHLASRAYNQQALRIYQEVGDQGGAANVMQNLSEEFLAAGDFATARSYLEQALAIQRAIQDQWRMGHTLRCIGTIFHRLGDHARARDYYQQALDLIGELGMAFYEGQALVYVSLLSHHEGDNLAAREQSERGLAIAREIGDRLGEGWLLDTYGHTLADLGDLARAADAYRQALALRRELDEPHLAAESLAGLARVALQRGNVSEAREQVAEILRLEKARGFGGALEPFRIWLTCYRVLEANQDPRAGEVLATAYERLQEQRSNIHDEDLERTFLENVAAHRELSAAYLAGQARSQSAVRLPRADAPTGRPLRDDEYVTITWAVTAPEDEVIEDGPNRRQAQIRRLLQEAADQGAAPTVGDLAAALAVSEPTIRRDLAALRRAGHPAQTRGSRGG
jgi:DNA-binding SARP family transcriptional activator/tetratricopeptide (TPR) repeat protein